jgi:hypothetical protein
MKSIYGLNKEEIKVVLGWASHLLQHCYPKDNNWLDYSMGPNETALIKKLCKEVDYVLHSETTVVTRNKICYAREKRNKKTKNV